MKTKLMLKVDDLPWQKLRVIAVKEGKTMNDKVIELIEKEVE